MNKSIQYFERCFLGGMAVGLINGVLTITFPSAAAANLSSTTLIISAIGSLVISLALLFWTSRKKSNIAKWILIIFFIFGVYSILNTLIAFFFFSATAELLGVTSYSLVIAPIALLLQAVGIYFLFTQEGRAWFKKTK